MKRVRPSYMDHHNSADGWLTPVNGFPNVGGYAETATRKVCALLIAALTKKIAAMTEAIRVRIYATSGE